MDEHQAHISSYKSLGIILVLLLICTIITIIITQIHLGAFTSTAAMLIACIKAGIVFTYFMHLKFDHVIYKIMVGGVLLIFALVLVLTFVDYWYR